MLVKCLKGSEFLLQDEYGALIQPNLRLLPTSSGRLDGWTFAAKDNIDVEGYVSSAGNPDWLRTHPPAERSAKVIRVLLAEGALLVGKTHTDELMYSLNGENYHYGTPKNPRDPTRIPGGSSSGSSVAVAAGLVDFALGTDTGGSVRIPSSYCGIYGIRPTHGRVSTEGVIKLAPSFCTVGWMAASASRLAEVGRVLLGLDPTKSSDPMPYTRCVVATDALNLAESGLLQECMNAVSRIFPSFQTVEMKSLSQEGLDLWLWAFRTIQSWEIWETHGDWIEETKPTFGPGVAERFAAAKTVTPDRVDLAQRIREKARARLRELLGDDGVIVMPTAPGPAPVLNWDKALLDEWRSRAMQLTCPAGLAGLPQVTMPWLELNGLPVGFSLLGSAGDDIRLLQLACRMEEN